MSEPGTAELPTGLWALIGFVVSGRTRTENLVRLIKAATISVISVLLVVAVIAGSVLMGTGHLGTGLGLVAGAVTSPVLGGLGWKGWTKLRCFLRSRNQQQRDASSASGVEVDGDRLRDRV
ncbi:hypothetical protein AB0L41_44145 [Amycolatopsis mediterranei]|uniref:hypothetical protein n=1 Tax=Amycolatopsis mediterranei TaxID=33910 RepID=UPI00341E9794